jgi:hypothetical protein
MPHPPCESHVEMNSNAQITVSTVDPYREAYGVGRSSRCNKFTMLRRMPVCEHDRRVPTAVLAVRNVWLASSTSFKMETVAAHFQLCLNEIVHPERFEKPPVDAVSVAGRHALKEVELSDAVSFVPGQALFVSVNPSVS